MHESRKRAAGANPIVPMIEEFVGGKGRGITNPSNPLPVYCQVEEFLRQLISELSLSKGTQLPSDQELAKILGISHLTLRRAQERLCKEGILYKSHGKGTFVGDVDQLKLGRREDLRQQFIGLVIPSVEHYYSELIRAVEEKAREADFKFVLSISKWWDPDKEDRQLDKLAALKGIKGILISPHIILEILKKRVSRYKGLAQLGISVVCIDRDVSDMGLSCVFFDDRRGAKRAVTHLINLGHKRIGFILPATENLRNRERFSGYKDALQENQLTYDGALVLKCSDRFLDDLKALMNHSRRPTALFCGNDYYASVVMDYMSGLGIKIPEDLAICGYDGPTLKTGPSSSLTTMFRDRYVMGIEAMKILIRQMRMKGERSIERTILSPELVIKGSCGAQIHSSSNSSPRLLNLAEYM